MLKRNCRHQHAVGFPFQAISVYLQLCRKKRVFGNHQFCKFSYIKTRERSVMSIKMTLKLYKKKECICLMQTISIPTGTKVMEPWLAVSSRSCMVGILGLSVGNTLSLDRSQQTGSATRLTRLVCLGSLLYSDTVQPFTPLVSSDHWSSSGSDCLWLSLDKPGCAWA